MFKLIKLEIKKFKIGFLKGTIIANLIILTLVVIAAFLSKASKEISFTDYNNMFLGISTYVRPVFIIYSAVLISKLIIDEYKNKTINIMFMYPIRRKKIMISKFLIVLIFCFTTLLLSTIFLDLSMYCINSFSHFFNDTLTMTQIVNNLTNIVAYSIAFAFISLIPVYVGLKRKSGSATIVTAIILSSALSSGSNGYSLSSIIIIPTILAIIGAVIAYLSIKDIEKVDVVNF
jgi:ABC-type transport system involved in multi-copper enzyme maturation permease subunit